MKLFQSFGRGRRRRAGRGVCILIFSLGANLAPAQGGTEFCGEIESNHPTAGWAGLSNLQPEPGPDWTLGRKRLLYCRVNFAEEAEYPLPEAEAEQSLMLAGQTFQTASYGKFSLEWTITPVLVIPGTAADYAGNAGREALLEAARQAAASFGFAHEDYDLDLVRHPPVPGSAGGYGNLGRRGAWIQVAGPGIIVHEIGHNLGLAHANFWDTSGPPSSPKISPPFPEGTSEGRHGHEFDPASLIGRDSMFGPGGSSEYGDLFDIMGGGGSGQQFNALFKHQLRWLEDSQIAGVDSGGTFRIHAFDRAPPEEGRFYALRIQREIWMGRFPRFYWVQFRSEAARDGFTSVEIHWGDGARQTGPSLLIDTTPGTPHRQMDAALALGRTFADPFSEIYITPVAAGGSAEAPWVEVTVQLGPFPENRAPSLTLASTALEVPPDASVQFTAVAEDEDGDALAFFWDFGDHSTGAGAEQEKRWAAPGEYLVRCEVSDLKGGWASKHVVVTVGAPGTLRMSGRVLDEAGQPVPGVRVHNGRVFRNAEGTDYVWTLTDSDGAYTLVNLKAGSYTNAAVVFGRRTVPANFTPPVLLTDTHRDGLDFIAHQLPEVSVRPASPRIKEGESVEFVFTRTGALDRPVTVPFSVGGTAEARVDYPEFMIHQVTIPAGAGSASLLFLTFTDGEEEGEETVILRPQVPAESLRTQVGPDGGVRTFKVYYPGWELLPMDGVELWTQTYPDFVVAFDAPAVLTIEDSDAPAENVVNVHASDVVAIEDPLVESGFTLWREGSLTQPLTLFYELSGTAENGVDYQRLEGSAVIPSGLDYVTVVVLPIADGIEEGTETVTLTLLDGENYRAGIREATVWIRDQGLLAPSLDLRWTGEGPLEIHLTAPAGRQYVLEDSTDLARWTPVRTNLLFANPLIFQVQPPEGPGRFYRVR